MTKAGNWAPIQRKLIKTDLWLSEPFTRGQAWVDMILMAAYRPGHVRIRGVRIDYARGQIATAERFLCERWKWSRGKVRRFLSELESDCRIVQVKSAVSTLITITNYHAYQGDGTSDGPLTVPQTGQQTVPQTGQQTDQIEERITNTTKQKKEKKPRGKAPAPPVFELPEAVQTEALTKTVSEWLAYKAERRESYQPTGLRNLIGQISRAVVAKGEAAIIAKFERAMASNWAGWDFHDDAPRAGPARPGFNNGPSHTYHPGTPTRDEI